MRKMLCTQHTESTQNLFFLHSNAKLYIHQSGIAATPAEERAVNCQAV